MRHFIITRLGENILSENHVKIDVGYLHRFPEFSTFYARGKGKH